jgi:cell division protein FtsB
MKAYFHTFNLCQFLLHFFSMSADFLRRIKKKGDLRSLLSKLWSNKKLSGLLAAAFVILLYVLFNNQGVLQRIKLEREKKVMLQKIQQAEQEQKQLQDQSKALDGDKKAIEKVAREKYGMVREGEKVYKVVPKK